MAETYSIKPSAITFIQNFSPNDVTYLRDSPSAVDSSNLVATSTTQSAIVDLTFDFEGELTGTQTINVHYVDNNWVGLHIEVRENSISKYISPTVFTGYSNKISSFTFDSSILDDTTGVNMAIRVIGHTYNGLSINHLSAVRLVATYIPSRANELEVIRSLKTDWLPTDYYNFEDLNRVEQATEIVRDRIAIFRGENVPIDIVTNRSESHIEFADSLNRIENNILQLKLTFPNTALFEFSKTDWVHDTPFDFSDANRLERNLYDMFYAIEANISNIPYCGQIIAGQEGVV